MGNGWEEKEEDKKTILDYHNNIEQSYFDRGLVVKKE